MIENVTLQSQTEKRMETPAVETLFREDAIRLINQLHQAGMLKSTFKFPDGWVLAAEVSRDELVAVIQKHLSRVGYHRILEALRFHNRQPGEALWRFSSPADFLAAMETTLRQHPAPTKEGIRDHDLKELLGSSSGNKISALTQELQRQILAMMQTLKKPAGAQSWLLSPRAIWTQMKARAERANAAAQIERTLGKAALYAARMVGSEAETKITLSRVDRLRTQLRRQLEVFCQEQGLPLPRPYSREEAYCLHLLTAYFVSLAEAEKEIALRGSSLARRQIALEGECSEADLDNKVLPELLDILSRIDPLREGFLRERVRHKSALMVSAVIAAIGGSILGLFESISDVIIAGVSRYAPVITPAMLVGLATLAAQTVVRGVPLTLEMLLNYLAHALWNSALALGATLAVYGSWLYFSSRSHKHGQSPSPAAASPAGQGDDLTTANHPA